MRTPRTNIAARPLSPIVVYAMLSAFLGLAAAIAIVWARPGLMVAVATIIACYLLIVGGAVFLAKRKLL